MQVPVAGWPGTAARFPAGRGGSSSKECGHFIVRVLIMKYSLKSSLVLLALWCALLAPLWGHAGIVIKGTRVVYDEARGETHVQLRQAGDVPSLVQIWLDTGDDSIDAYAKQTPFLITPTVTRMDPGVGQSIRILRAGNGLPQGRESMLFFNVLEIPPVPAGQDAAGDNYIQFSSRARLKFFYRPKGLSPAPEKAHQLLGFSLSQGEGGALLVQIHNPSPYHVTFKTLALRQGEEEDGIALAQLSKRLGVNHTTVAPLAELVLPMDAEAGSLPASGLNVRYEVVGDYGNIISGQRALD